MHALIESFILELLIDYLLCTVYLVRPWGPTEQVHGFDFKQ